MNKYAKKYYKKVYKAFPQHSQNEKQYLQHFKEIIEDIECQSYDDYVDILGQPYDIAWSYYKHIDYSLMIEKLKTQRLIQKFIVSILVFIALLTLWVSYLKYVEFQSYQNDYYYTDTYIS